jgi:hypothetical protein
VGTAFVFKQVPFLENELPLLEKKRLAGFQNRWNLIILEHLEKTF